MGWAWMVSCQWVVGGWQLAVGRRTLPSSLRRFVAPSLRRSVASSLRLLVSPPSPIKRLIRLLQISEETHPLLVLADTAEGEKLEEPCAVLLGGVLGRRRDFTHDVSRRNAHQELAQVQDVH